jgi:hypothetical protein
MVTTKKGITKATLLRFKPEWISDPPPPFFKNLDKSVVRELAQAKKDFATRVKEILVKAQQR